MRSPRPGSATAIPASTSDVDGPLTIDSALGVSGRLTGTGSAPGPEPRRMLADVPRIMADPLRYLEHAVATWGDLVAFPVGTRTALFVNDPDGVDQVLRRNAAAYGKETLQYQTLSLLTGQGLLTAPTAVWRERRRQVAPAFHRRTLDGLLATTDAAATRMIPALRPAGAGGGAAGGEVRVEAAIQAATLDIVAGALFGADLHDDAARLAHAVVSGLDGVIGRATTPLKLPLRVPTPANVRLRRSLRELDTVVARLLRDRSAEKGAAREPDLLDLLLEHVGDPTGIRDEIVTLIVAGHETVASALTWALWLLAGHPDVADAVAAEAGDVLDGAVPDLARLGRLRRTRAVLDETLRLYPPSWVLSRRALESDVVAGVPVAAGTLVIISPWTLHRRADSWADPQTFDPSRFEAAHGGTDASRLPAYVPFGAGQRMCIGRDFALLEATVLLARLAQSFELRRVPGHEVRAYARVTVRPRRPLVLGLRPRRLPVRPSAG